MSNPNFSHKICAIDFLVIVAVENKQRPTST